MTVLRGSWFLAFALAVISVACKSRTFSEPAAPSSVSSGEKSPQYLEIEKAIDSLHTSIQDNEMLAARYKEGNPRVEACWMNPAASKLSDIQRAYYCAVPLEVRLCNTPALRPIKKRWEGKLGWFRKKNIDNVEYLKQATEAFVNCQKSVDASFESKRTFVYSFAVNEYYRSIFLMNDSGLTSEEQATLSAKYKPKSTGLEFKELFKLSFDDLLDQLNEYQKKYSDDKWVAKVRSFHQLLMLIIGKKEQQDETVL